jgi:hypothetical protein
LSELDTALILHRQVWLAIQALGLPGKKGKARRELGWMKRKKPDRSSSVTIEGKGKNKLFMDGNHIRIEKSEAPGWNLKRFRRSLHYIASQLGMKKNDFLRQAVSYEYPRHHWEKDNFAIRPEYKDLIKEVLEELKEK